MYPCLQKSYANSKAFGVEWLKTKKNKYNISGRVETKIMNR